MPKYYVNKKAQSTGEHEIHTSDCAHKPLTENSLYLGEFSNCREAVSKAQVYYDNVDGCYYCCNKCHTK
ncbi:MAG: hypothetical protein AB7E51_05720 [Pseudodesulfovibrio sp.]|uniref:hypothetical protein n=1 Tax=Pseudodesulfovibrio sp. TaxID=2035812 RepID=UPI003D145693